MNNPDEILNTEPFNQGVFPMGVTHMPDPQRGTSARSGPDPQRGTSTRSGPDPQRGTSTRSLV